MLKNEASPITISPHLHLSNIFFMIFAGHMQGFSKFEKAVLNAIHPTLNNLPKQDCLIFRHGSILKQIGVKLVPSLKSLCENKSVLSCHNQPFGCFNLYSGYDNHFFLLLQLMFYTLLKNFSQVILCHNKNSPTSS